MATTKLTSALEEKISSSLDGMINVYERNSCPREKNHYQDFQKYGDSEKYYIEYDYSYDKDSFMTSNEEMIELFEGRDCFTLNDLLDKEALEYFLSHLDLDEGLINDKKVCDYIDYEVCNIIESAVLSMAGLIANEQEKRDNFILTDEMVCEYMEEMSPDFEYHSLNQIESVLEVIKEDGIISKEEYKKLVDILDKLYEQDKNRYFHYGYSSESLLMEKVHNRCDNLSIDDLEYIRDLNKSKLKEFLKDESKLDYFKSLEGDELLKNTNLIDFYKFFAWDIKEAKDEAKDIHDIYIDNDLNLIDKIKDYFMSE